MPPRGKRKDLQQSHYLRRARAYGTVSERHKKRRTTSFSDAVASVRLSRSIRTSRRKKIYRSMVKFLIIFLIIAGWGSLPLFLPFFRIATVTYRGLSNSDSEQAVHSTVEKSLKRTIGWWPRDNIFIFSAQNLQTELARNPGLRSVSVEKHFPGTLMVTAIEKTDSLVYFTPTGKRFILDETGAFKQDLGSSSESVPPSIAALPLPVTTSSLATVKTASDTPELTPIPTLVLSSEQQKDLPLAIKNIPRIIDFRSEKEENLPKQGTQILPGETAKIILAWADQLNRSGWGSLQIAGIDGEAPPYRLILKTRESWKILTDTAHMPEAGISALRTLLASQKPQSYVDIRFEGRIYWK